MATKRKDGMANAVADAGLYYPDLAVQAGNHAADDFVAASQAGDEAAFRSLYLAHRSEVHRIVYRLLGPNADVEDVLQEVFIQVHRSIGNFRGQSKFSTWLHRVAVNVALQHLRRKRSTVVSRCDDRVEERADEDGSHTSPTESMETQERLKAVYRALDQISPKKRAVLVMHDMQGMSAQKISEVVGSPVFTVRTRLFYARKEFYRRIVGDPAFAGDISLAELERK
jgi:RNA polymerase sigma-70 factor (ECF subfamily)